MDHERPPLSRGETEVLKAVWSIEKGAVGEIFAAMQPHSSMDYSTVQTYVRRLETKGYLTAKRVGRNKIYLSTVRKTQIITEAVDEFLERLFDGELLPMVKLAVDSREVSPKEIEDLMRIVKKLKRDQEKDNAE